MPHDHCCVYGCTNRRSKGQDLSFHHFPKDAESKGKWIQAIKRVEDGISFQVTGNTTICSQHFEEGCFHPRKQKASGEDATPRLRKGAVPTLFSFRPLPTKRPTPDDRRADSAARIKKHDEDEAAKRECPKRGQTLLEFTLGRELSSVRAMLKEQEAEVARLRRENEMLRSQLFRFENIKNDVTQMKFLTGLTPEIWSSVWSYLKPSQQNLLSVQASEKESEGRRITQGSGRPSKLSFEDQFLMLLMRLRLNRFEEELGYMFGVDISTVSRILNMWISYVYLRLGMIPIWPTWEDVAKTMPSSFRRLYPSTFAIIDATELPVETPSSLSLQSKLFSAYKKHCTVKGLLAISPNGMICFVSELYTGSISDRELTKASGLLKLLESVPPGRSIMADRGFAIQDLLVRPNLVLNTPPFKKSETMSRSDVVKTQKVASVRIHIERAIGRVKRRFHIFDRDIPLSMLGSINQIWAICCLLTNFFGPLIFEDKDSRDSDL